MTRKITFSFALLLLCLSYTFAQDAMDEVTITWGELSSDDSKFMMDRVIGVDSNGVYVIKKKKKSYSANKRYLAHYNARSLERDAFGQIPLGDKSEKRKFQQALLFQDSLYVFSFSKESDVGVLNVQTLNKETLQPQSALRKVLEIDFSKKGAFQLREFYEFDLDFVKEDLSEKAYRKMSKRAARKGKPLGLYDYKFPKIFFTESGDAFFIAEQYVVTEEIGYEQRHYTYYHYNNIFVMRISPKGHIRWARKVFKRQKTQWRKDGAFSYFPMVQGDDLYLLFNECSSESDEAEEDQCVFERDLEKTQSVLVKINREGEQNREVLFDEKDVQVFFLPKFCRKISTDELLLPGEYKTYDRVAVLRFDE